MKALSVKQPWAHLITSGEKSIEVRSWQTDYRGKLLICTSQAEKNYFFEVAEKLAKVPNELLLMPYGVACCIVELVDVRPLEKSDFIDAILDDDFDCEGQFAWVLANPVPVRFSKILGKLKLFEVADELIIPVLTTKDWLNQVREFAPDAKPNKGSLILEYE